MGSMNTDMNTQNLPLYVSEAKFGEDKAGTFNQGWYFQSLEGALQWPYYPSKRDACTHASPGDHGT